MSQLSTAQMEDDPEVPKELSQHETLRNEKIDEKKGGETVIVQEAPSMDDFPEGGTQAWLTVFGAFLVQFASFGYVNSFGVYQDFYVRKYLTTFSPSSIGWIGGIQVFFTFSTGTVVGPLYDRGYLRYLLITGTILHSLSLFMLSLSHENSFYQVFLSSGVALGLSSGITYVPSLTVPTHYFRRKRALAIGMTSSGSALGAVVHPIILNQLFNKGKIGFHNGVRISAGINTFLLVCAILMIRTRLPPKPTQRFPVRQWLRELSFLTFVIAACFVLFGLLYPVFYLQLFAITHGVDSTFSFYSLSILNAASILGRIIPGQFAPRLGAYNLLVTFTTIAGIIVLFMVLLKNVAGIAFYGILYGFFSGAGIALLPAAAARLAKDPNEFGTRMGVIFAMSGLIGLFSVPISGALLTKDYHWLHAGLFSGIFLIASGMCFALSRYYFAKERGIRTLWL